jgi:hypothetical protein
MNRCLIARAMGAAAGGLLGSALLPMAVAFADDYAIVPDPSSMSGPSMPTRLPLRAAMVTKNFSLPPTFQAP